MKRQKKAHRHLKVKGAVAWTFTALAAVGMTGMLVYRGFHTPGHIHLPIAVISVVVGLVCVAVWKIIAIWL